MNGGREVLSPEQLEFVGVEVSRRRDTSGGWHQPDEFRILQQAYELDAEPSPEDAAILQKLMSVGSQERLEFFG